MKFIAALLLFVAVPAALALFSPEVADILYNLEVECSAKSGLTAEHVDVVRTNYNIPDNEVAKKWAKCMLQKYNAINADDTVNLNIKTVRILDDTTSVWDAFKICSKVVGRNIDDTAMLMWNCYAKNSQGLLMAPHRRVKTDERKRFLNQEDTDHEVITV